MMRRIVDYELEGWINSYSAVEESPRRGEAKLTWQQRVQYAVGHTINDYYTLIPAVRLRTPIQVLLNRRWPRNQHDFPDPVFYWQVYNRVVDQLALITGMMIYDYPVALYENWTMRSDALGMQISIIFQALWQDRGDPTRVTVQKFLLEDNEELVKAFTHLTNVFWHGAFGRPPGIIEVYTLLDERKHDIAGESLDLQASLDYVRLLADARDSEIQGMGEKERHVVTSPEIAWAL